ncbi:extracellular ribonuclease le, partial [Quercus suber]
LKPNCAIFIKLLLVQCLAIGCVSKDFDFFYLVQQGPGSYCDTRQSRCYQTTGKPKTDFGIHGLWPNYNDDSYPSNYDPNSPYVQSKVPMSY